MLDDLQDPADVRDLWPIPSRSGRVLVTTRRRDSILRTAGREVLDVGLFTPTEAAAFPDRRLPGRSAGARQLADALGHLPLALAHAAAYIADRPTLTCMTYLDRLRSPATGLAGAMPGEDSLPDDYHQTITATYALSIARAAAPHRPRPPTGADRQ
ncbi:hypothetical protein [Amycolatopsis sp. NPDC003731]